MNLLNYILGFYYFDLTGMNVERFLMYLKERKIYLSDIKRLSHNHFKLKTTVFCASKCFEAAGKLCYNISVEKTSGLLSIFFYFKKHLALFIGLVFVSICMFVSNLFIFQIKIYGLENLSQEEIISYLHQNNIKAGTLKSAINGQVIQQGLINQFDEVSLVSVSVYGSAVVINIKEKIFNEEMGEFNPLVATYDGIISDFVLISGTPVVKVGDIVKKGDTLVLPYVVDAYGEKYPMLAKAEVRALVTFSNTCAFEEQSTQLIRTGNCITESYFTIFGITIYADSVDINYDSYEVEERVIYVFNNNLIPIKKVTKTYYQTTPTVINKVFEQEQDNLRIQTTNEAKKLIPADYDGTYLVQTLVNIVDDTYYVTTNISITILIN